MIKPTLREFDEWRTTSVGKWFFDEVLVKDAQERAMLNGRAVGVRGPTLYEDYMILAKEAGVIEGILYAINEDPFEDERKELADSDQVNLDRQESYH